MALTLSGSTDTGYGVAADTNGVRININGVTKATFDTNGNMQLSTAGNTLSVGTTTAVSLGAGYSTLHVDGSTGAGLRMSHSGTGKASVFLSVNDLYFDVNNAAGQFFWRNTGDGSTYMSLNGDGGLLLGAHQAVIVSEKLSVGDTRAQGTLSFIVHNGAASGIQVFSVSTDSFNAAGAAAKFGYNGGTSRSINAGGTINASGADYAEYMRKCGEFVIQKGDICGVTADGKLTNVFADAVSFVVKSTDPSYVGGDKWGVGLEGDDLEAARQQVDRIAFAGQVPVNVLGATAGDYIVPVQIDGEIKGVAISAPTLEQYMAAVGKVIAIEDDGRARIIVKVA